jgi:acyl carrier protein
MTKNEFIELFAERLQIANTDLNIDTRLDSLDEWDSWNKLALMGLVDETFQVNLSANDLQKIVTIQDLINIIGINKFE